MHAHINMNITCSAGKTSYKQQRDQAHLCQLHLQAITSLRVVKAGQLAASLYQKLAMQSVYRPALPYCTSVA